MLNSFSAARQTKSKQSLETGDVNVKSFVGYRWDIEGQRPLCAEAIWIYENLFIFFPVFIPVVKEGRQENNVSVYYNHTCIDL